MFTTMNAPRRPLPEPPLRGGQEAARGVRAQPEGEGDLHAGAEGRGAAGELEETGAVDHGAGDSAGEGGDEGLAGTDLGREGVAK